MTITLNGTTGITFPNGGTQATGISTPVTVANGGTGLSSVGTSGNVLTSNGTSWVSQAPSGGVTSLNGQTGAITNTSVNAIGSYVYTYSNSGGGTVGGTLSASSLAGYTNFPLSGTWRVLNAFASDGNYGIFVRIS